MDLLFSQAYLRHSVRPRISARGPAGPRTTSSNGWPRTGVGAGSTMRLAPPGQVMTHATTSRVDSDQLPSRDDLGMARRAFWSPHEVASRSRLDRVRAGRAQSGRTILRAVEDLAGQREVLRREATSSDPPTGSPTDAGPHLDAALGGASAIVANGEGSTFTASISYRFGRATERVFGSRMTAVRRRMRDESESLSQIIEAA